MSLALCQQIDPNIYFFLASTVDRAEKFTTHFNSVKLSLLDVSKCLKKMTAKTYQFSKVTTLQRSQLLLMSLSQKNK